MRASQRSSEGRGRARAGRASVSTALALSTLLTTALAPTRAQGAPPDAEQWSRQLFTKAQGLAGDAQWSEACPFFQAAHDLKATGGTALRAADCYEKVGAYPRALEMYQWIVDHRATEKVTERIALAEGRVAALKKQLTPDQPVALTPAAPLASAPPPPPTPSRAPAVAAFAVGGAGVVVAGVFGALALTDASAIKRDAATRCPARACDDADLAARKGAATTQAWVANAGVGVAVAGAVVGTILLITRSSHRAEPPQQALLRAVSAGGPSVRF